MTLLDELREFWRTEPRDHRLALVVIIGIGIVLRLLTLSQPMRYDESVTWLEFVRLPLAQALSRYDYPNNHVFHTVLAKGSVVVFGSAPWALRLPAMVAGVLIMPLAYAVARTLYGGRPALLAVALVASSGVLSLYSTNARGYSIVVLAFLALMLIAIRLLRAPNMSLWAALAVVSAIGVWTIPVMLYPLGAVALWLALSFAVEGRRRELWLLAAALAAGAALTLLAYSPVFARMGVAAVIANKFVASSEWTQFLNDLALSSWGTLKSWGLGLPPVAFSIVLAAAVLALSRHARLNSLKVGLPLAAFVWSAWLLVVTHRAPVPRIWLWCVPVVASLAGAGIADVLDRSRRLKGVARRVPLLAVGIALGATASVAISGAVTRARDTGTFVEAEATALQLSHFLRRGDRVLVAIPGNGPLSYYLDRLGVDSAYMRVDPTNADRLIVVVNEGEGETIQDVVQGPVNDTTRYSASIIAERPMSKVYLLERRNATK